MTLQSEAGATRDGKNGKPVIKCEQFEGSAAKRVEKKRKPLTRKLTKTNPKPQPKKKDPNQPPHFANPQKKPTAKTRHTNKHQKHKHPKTPKENSPTPQKKTRPPTTKNPGLGVEGHRINNFRT